MIDNKKVSSYLLYAMGEVFLVVLGILIAVSLNNWNEQTKSDQQAEILLRQIQDDALTTIENIDKQIEFYSFKDSLYQIVVADTVSAEKYLKPESYALRLLTYQWITLTIPTKGFESYMEQAEMFSPKYRGVKASLADTYGRFESDYNVLHQSLMNTTNLLYEFARSQPWYSSVYTREKAISPDFIEYLKNDFRYKNMAESYNRTILGLGGHILNFKSGLIDVYKEINAILEHPRQVPPIIKAYDLELSPQAKQGLVGSYYSENDEEIIRITLDNNELYIKYRNGGISKVDKINQDYFLVSVEESFQFKIYYSVPESKICRKDLFKENCFYKK